MGLLGGTAEHLLAREGVASREAARPLEKGTQARGSQRAPTLTALGTGFGDSFTFAAMVAMLDLGNVVEVPDLDCVLKRANPR